MKTGRAFICSFDAVEYPPRKNCMTYDTFKEAVLKAGRFSIFEATENQRMAGLYTKLAKDPTVVFDRESVGFPWTLVALSTPLY